MFLFLNLGGFCGSVFRFIMIVRLFFIFIVFKNLGIGELGLVGEFFGGIW